MNAPASITITPVRVADLLAEGERMPLSRLDNKAPLRYLGFGPLYTG